MLDHACFAEVPGKKAESGHLKLTQQLGHRVDSPQNYCCNVRQQCGGVGQLL